MADDSNDPGKHASRDLPASELKEGDVGAVVGVNSSGGCEVEFTAADGATVDVVTLAGDDLRHDAGARSPCS